MAKPYHLLLLVLAGPYLYGVGLCMAAGSDGAPLLEANCFDAAGPGHFSAARLLAAAAMACGAALLLCFTPWWLGTRAIATRFPGKQGTAHVWSLAGNTAMLVMVCFVLRNTAGIGRGSFLAAWLLWTAALAGLARRRETTAGSAGHPLAGHGVPGNRQTPFIRNATEGVPYSHDASSRMQLLLVAILGLAAVAACLALFHREIFLQCFNGDGTELDELAHSLRGHFLPYWEIEPTGKFGAAVVNPLVTSSYWTLGFQVLLGGGELPTRLPYWMWWLGIYLAATSMARGVDLSPPAGCGGLKPTLQTAIPVALLLLLAALWYTFYAGYDPYQGDIANPGVSDAMFALWLLLGFDCLRQKDLGGWVVATVAASLLFYAGAVVFGLTVAAALLWQPIARRDMRRAGLAGGGILVVLLCAYLAWGAWQGTLSAWFASFQEEWLSKYFDPQPRGPQGILFLGYFLLGCGGAPALGLFYLLWRGAPWQRTAAAFILAYLAIILGCGAKNLHYLGPLLPLTLVLWLASARSTGFSRNPAFAGAAAALTATLGLAASIWLCWPPQRPTFTLNRDLGKQTLFRTGDYAEACRWARIRSQLYQRGDLGWQVSQHTWVGYAARSAEAQVSLPLCVTDVGPPAASYELVYEYTQDAGRAISGGEAVDESPVGVKLYCRDPQLRKRLAAQRPMAGPQRFPWVFQPIAPRPEPRELAAPR